MKNTVTFTCSGQAYRSDSPRIEADGFILDTVLQTYPAFGAVYEQHIISGAAEAPGTLIGDFTDADLLLPLTDRADSREDITAGTALRVMRMNGTVPGSFYSRDDLQSASEYALTEDRLRTKRVYENVCGRSSDGILPLFDISNGKDGYIIFLGWTGSWHAEFEPAEGGVHAVLRLKNNTFRLPAGESLHTLSTLILEYHDGQKAARNRFRRLLKAHFSTVGQPGRPENAMSCFELWGALPSDEMCRRVDTLKSRGIRFDYLWIDAGWYGHFTEDCPSPFHGTWFSYTGSWNINPHPHPDGLADVVRHAEAAGMRMDLWVEPERSVTDMPVVRAHPEWFTILPGSGPKSAVLDLGNPAAWQYAFDTLCSLADTLKLGCYRQDFNVPPDDYWKAGRTSEEAALAELRHINGMYRLWDALLARYPHLLIDNCCSGGRRFDLETVRRAVPFFRSDYTCSFTPDPDVTQCHNGISEYLPYNGCMTKVKSDDYAVRSTYTSAWGLACWNTAFQSMDDADLAWAARISAEYARLQPYFSCDFYSLASTGFDKTSWVVWQYDRPEQGDGVILGFRRAASECSAMTLTPGGLQPGRRYAFTDLDTGETFETGELLTLQIPEKRMSRILLYRVL